MWGGDPGCDHEWGDDGKSAQRNRNGSGASGLTSAGSGKDFVDLHPSTGSFCRRCGAWRGSLGLEPTLYLYLDHMVEICREIRRVLRKDGTFWLNVGDSYCNYRVGDKGGMPGQTVHGGRVLDKPGRVRANKGNDGADTGRASGCPRRATRQPGLKEKDLMLIPSRLAIRLQDDGWWVRSEIIWAKSAPMPESVTDRPTSAHEKIFLLTKSACYYFDAEARMPREVAPNEFDTSSGRNMRNVWHLGPSPFPESHFATFPPELPRRAILAGTSERGVCPKCSAPYKRTLAKGQPDKETTRGLQSWTQITGQRDSSGGLPHRDTETIGWRATCSCDAGCGKCAEVCEDCSGVVAATVLDPFAGAGTSLMVADQLQRNAIGIELSPKYITMMRRRIEQDAGMFADIAAD